MIATSATIAPGVAAPSSCEPIARPLIEIFQQLVQVLHAAGDSLYTQRMGPLFADSTIGGHVRHCLDHARALLDGKDCGTVDYDHRLRGTDIETSTTAAHRELTRLIGLASRLCPTDADEELSVVIMPSRDGRALDLRSTLGRELAFVLSHTIHHNATIRGMAVSLGVAIPDALGYAPSTLAHRDSAACAR